MSWLTDNWADIYLGGALLCGALSALAVFGGIWWYAAAKYELGGLVLGWLPGGIAAFVVGWVIGLGWPLFAPLAFWLASPVYHAVVTDNR